ncbi:MAG: hypothetical protein EZS28_005497 [Streblomastix strix]|uniref:Uncharacterized protein n=1 Tax=Streblomastix strix TaxID=222440 RepID=A0A5J4WVA0_9EUKA|nr:MAG: hypothetical protein EZS28_005497 [Streblomastix strix]
MLARQLGLQDVSDDVLVYVWIGPCIRDIPQFQKKLHIPYERFRDIRLYDPKSQDDQRDLHNFGIGFNGWKQTYGIYKQMAEEEKEIKVSKLRSLKLYLKDKKKDLIQSLLFFISATLMIAAVILLPFINQAREFLSDKEIQGLKFSQKYSFLCILVSISIICFVILSFLDDYEYVFFIILLVIPIMVILSLRFDCVYGKSFWFPFIPILLLYLLIGISQIFIIVNEDDISLRIFIPVIYIFSLAGLILTILKLDDALGGFLWTMVQLPILALAIVIIVLIGFFIFQIYEQIKEIKGYGEDQIKTEEKKRGIWNETLLSILLF